MLSFDEERDVTLVTATCALHRTFALLEQTDFLACAQRQTAITTSPKFAVSGDVMFVAIPEHAGVSYGNLQYSQCYRIWM